jgi:APA family basic amino acid/polyamine antiporter
LNETVEQAPNHLERKLGLFSVTNIVIANMVGAGIFTTSGLLMENIGSPMVMLMLWVIGGVIALCGAMCYGELGAHFPKAGGEYTFLSELYSPLIGFLSGWVSFIAGFSAAVAAVSIGFSEYLYRMIPGVYEMAPIAVASLHKSIAIFLILLFTYVHVRGVEFGAAVQNWLTVFKIVLVVGLILVGFIFGSGDLKPIIESPEYTFDFAGLKTIALGLVWVMFAYTGWNASVYIGSEIKNPERNLPGSLILGTLVVTGMYLLLNLLFVYSIGPEAMKGVIPVGSESVKHMFGESAEAIFSGLVAFAFLSSISAFIIIGPRVCYAMAKDGFFIPAAAKIHPVYETPHVAIIIQGVFASIIVLTGTLEQIFTFIGFALSFFPLLVVAGVFKLRRRTQSSTRLPGFPFTALIFLFATSVILVLGFLERPQEAIIAIICVAAGLPAYYWLRANKVEQE